MWRLVPIANITKNVGAKMKGLLQVRRNIYLVEIFEEISQTLKHHEKKVPKKTIEEPANLVVDKH